MIREVNVILQTEYREVPIRISLAIKTQGNDSQMELGIVAVNGNNQTMAQWALKEYS